MELAEGMALRQLCGTPLHLRQLISIGRQIADALTAAHAAGVVHRDMKPENVMVRTDGRIKVLDFGLARRLAGFDGSRSATTLADAFAGTWRYMSPEQVKGKPATEASDVFSFGLILYELAAGRHAFETSSPFETLQAITEAEPKPPSRWNPQLPEHLDALIIAALSKNPADRPSPAWIFRVLAAWETGQLDPAALDQARLDRLPRRKGHRARRWIPALLIPPVLLAAVLWYFYRPRNLKAVLQQVTTLVPENRATAAAISPNAVYTAYANRDGIFVRENQSGETNAMRSPKDFVVDQISWLASGAKLIASGFFSATNQPAIWSISVTGAEPRELRADARGGIPSPDGTRIAFVTPDRSAIWTAGLGGEEPRRIVDGRGDDLFESLVWSPDGRHLGFQRRHYSTNQDLGVVMEDRYYQRSFGLADADTGKTTASLPDLWIQSAASLPDGRILFLRFRKPGSNDAREIWITRILPGGALSPPSRLVSLDIQDRDRVYGLSATSDGTRLVTIRQSNQDAVFIADFSHSPPRLSNAYKLTLDERSNFPHAWTADGRSVIFESDRGGSWDIFRQRIDSHTPEAIVASPRTWDVLPQLTPDGNSVLYAVGLPDHEGPPYSLMRVSLDGGNAEPVFTDGPLEEFQCALHARCVLRTSMGRQYYVFHELDPVRGIGKELARTAWFPSVLGEWNLAASGTEVAIPDHRSRSARIRIVSWKEGLRESEVEAPGLGDLSEVNWAADGTGWFVTVETSIGTRLEYLQRDGRLFPLGDISGYALPSPNGRKVAYMNRISASNVWTIDLK
jgi:Tol biopolymer transport system component